MATPYRQFWDDYIFKSMKHLANSPKGGMFNTGVIALDGSPVFTQGDNRKRVPLLDDLDTILGESDQRITSDGTLQVKYIDGGTMFAPIIQRGDALGQKWTENVLTGIDAAQAYSPQIAARNLNQLERKMISVTTGAFASGGPLALSHKYGDGTKKLDAAMVKKSQANKLGENGGNLNVLYVNSIVEADLYEQGVVLYVNAGTYGQQAIISGTIPTLGGARIMVNDRLCKKVSHTINAVDTTDNTVTTSDAHGFSTGQAVVFAGSDLPAGLTAGTTYYVIATGLTTTTFSVATAAGGSAVDITDAGSGARTVSGNQYNSYLMGPSAYYLGYQRSMSVDQFVDHLKAGKTWVTYWLLSYAPTLWGISYTASTDNPDESNLETGSSWESVLPAHEIRVLQLYHNLSTDP